MNTDIKSYLEFFRDKRADKGACINHDDLGCRRSMSEIGRQNVKNSQWAINALSRSLNFAIREYGIPATVSHFLSPRYPYDLAIRPLPGAMFKPTGINSLFWTNTPNRHDALYWSREFSGWRLYPVGKPDKALGLARWVDSLDPYDQAHAWAAVTTRATSDEGGLLCRWAPFNVVMQFYARRPDLPLAYLLTCDSTIYDAQTKRFEIGPDLLAKILGIPMGVAS
jgi:hypothetical protein